MPAERSSRASGVARLAAIGVAVCCGMPLLLSAGAGVTIAGLGLRSWLLAVAGVVTVAAGVSEYRHRTRCARSAAERAER